MMLKHLWIPFFFLLAFVAWAVAHYDFASVGEALANADWRFILAGAVLDVLLLYFRVFKWRFFFGDFRKMSFYNMSLAALVAYTCNMVIPARIGGLIQAWLLDKKEATGKSFTLGTVALVRTTDGISLLLITFFLFLVMEVPPDKADYWALIQKGGFIVTMVLLGIVLLLYLFRNNNALLKSATRLVTALTPQKFRHLVPGVLTSFRDGLAVLNQKHYLLLIMVLSVTFWSLGAVSVFLFLKAFGIEGMSFTMPLFILLVQIVGFLIPSPGYIGPYHAATVIALSFYGIVGEFALSIAIVMHAAMFLTNTLPGLVYLWMENITFKTVIDEVNK